MDQVAAPEKESVFAVRPVSCDLGHPSSVGRRRDSGDLDPTRLQVDHEEHEVPHEPAPREPFDREEVCRGNRSPMRLQERLPAYRPTTTTGVAKTAEWYKKLHPVGAPRYRRPFLSSSLISFSRSLSRASSPPMSCRPGFLVRAKPGGPAFPGSPLRCLSAIQPGPDRIEDTERSSRGGLAILCRC